MKRSVESDTFGQYFTEFSDRRTLNKQKIDRFAGKWVIATFYLTFSKTTVKCLQNSAPRNKENFKFFASIFFLSSFKLYLFQCSSIL